MTIRATHIHSNRGSDPGADAPAVAIQLRDTAGWLLAAGGGRSVRQLYDAATAAARCILAGDRDAAAGALAAARRALPRPRRPEASSTASLLVEALDRAERWLLVRREGDREPERAPVRPRLFADAELDGGRVPG